ncbi:MAG: glycosyltransferase family 4 protein [Marinomonas sp.]
MIKKIVFDGRWDRGGIGRFSREVRDSNTICVLTKIEGALSQALSVKDLFSLSKITLRGDYFISPGYNCPLFSAGRAIVTIHDLMHLKFSAYLGIKNKLYYELIVKRTVRSAPLVFTVSEFTRQEISEWADVPLEKIAVVPNGVDHEFYHMAVEPMVRNRPYFFYVGNNKSHKNLHRLIQSFALSGISKDMDLLLSCGVTSELSQLVIELGLSNVVVFLDGIEEALLPGYYKGAIATVVASLYEGFCLPILESMAVGTPVITSNITAMPETAGGAAILVDPYDIQSIQQALRTIWQNDTLRSELVEKGLLRAQEFSWSRSRALWDNALAPILEKT